jgi:signal transduction histidine kinase
MPTLARLAELVDRVRAGGVPVELTVEGTARPLAPGVELCAYRVVQEALTNAVRYAGDAKIEVQIIYAPHAITVFVDDDGPGAAAVGRPGGGHGLVGMSERLATIGGSLQAGPRTPDPGWRAYASIPVLAAAA